MQAIELNAVITQNHEIHLKLSDDIKATHAKVIVMYEDNTKLLPRKWDKFFASKSVFDDDFLAERDNDIPQERGVLLNAHAGHQHLRLYFKKAPAFR